MFLMGQRRQRRRGMRRSVAAASGMLLVGAFFGVAAAEPADRRLSMSVDANRYAGPSPLRVKFSAAASNPAGAAVYRWCFDDGAQSSQQRPTHSFRRAGYYKVVAQVQDSSGARGRQTILIGAWPPRQWAEAKSNPLTEKEAARGQRAQRRRTALRRKRLRLRDGLTLAKCTRQPLSVSEPPAL
jgi:hypothetical protein